MWLMPFVATLTFTTPLAGASEACAAEQTPVALLATYHFVSKQNVYQQADDDELTAERQAQLEDLANRLSAFHPTRIAVERPYDQAELNRRYAAYLADQYDITAEETDQIAFRLGKREGVTRLDFIQYVGDFPLADVEAFAKRTDQQARYNAAMAKARELVVQLDAALARGGVVGAMRFFNTPEAIAANHQTYIALNALADTADPSGGDRPGPDLTAAWYRTNLNIFANIQNLAGKDERVFVLYGQGHAHILRQLIRDDPTMCLVDLLPLLEN